MNKKSRECHKNLLNQSCVPLSFQALQHGVGKCEGDVDGSSQEWEGKEEVEASE